MAGATVCVTISSSSEVDKEELERISCAGVDGSSGKADCLFSS